jgi:hypothetical protein
MVQVGDVALEQAGVQVCSVPWFEFQHHQARGSAAAYLSRRIFGEALLDSDEVLVRSNRPLDDTVI